MSKSRFVYSDLADKEATVIEPGKPEVVDCSAKLCPLFVVSQHVEDDMCLREDCGIWFQSRHCCGLIATVK